MKKNTLGVLLLFISLAITSCTSLKSIVNKPNSTPQQVVNLALIKDAPADKYVNPDYGIKLNISDDRASQDILKQHDGHAIDKPIVKVNPDDIKSFVYESMKRYMRTMGFSMESNVSTDYLLEVSIDEFHISYLSGIGWSGTVKLNIKVYDNNHKLVYPNTSIIGRSTNGGGSGEDYVAATNVMNKAYINALEDIDWDRIAFFLIKANNPSLEKNKQVTGEGNTALENTVINWSVYSSPAGADVYFRVLSSTEDVKNTNRNYLGTTPFESTETLDIKGLTYNNSGNVQIEITCEKEGYAMQKKKFNVRQVLDQKDISTKFNLVAE